MLAQCQHKVGVKWHCKISVTRHVDKLRMGVLLSAMYVLFYLYLIKDLNDYMVLEMVGQRNEQG